MENLFASFDISGQGMTVQRMRLNAAAKNIANANVTKDEYGEPYRREIVLVRAIPDSPFQKLLNRQIALSSPSSGEIASSFNSNFPWGKNQVLRAISVKDVSAPRLVYDPSHPDADEKGYVKYPNINVVTEMVEMISAQRSFQANVQSIQAAKNIARDSLEI